MQRLPALFLVWLRGMLNEHSQSICFSLALLISLILSFHTVLAPVYPIGDGEGYVTRGFALYGYLHTGQWSQFWKLLSSPNQSVFPLHYLPFFLLPQGIASVASYVAAQNLTTYLLLAYAAFKFSEALNRPEWAPALFLLCGVNNFALADYGAFYLDMEFFALGLFVMAWQITAWREKRNLGSLVSGVGLGLLFWMKPANAFIFLGTFVLSELGHAVGVLFLRRTEIRRTRRLLNLLRHWECQSLGFIPVFGLALACGGVQTILQLINNNEVQGEALPVDCGYPLRLFYFPLCLAYYYDVLLLGLLLSIALLMRRWRWIDTDQDEPDSFPGHLFIPVALAFLVFGELFSFWMVVKPMRSLLPTLPLMGIALYWLVEKRRVPNALIFLVAMTYGSMAFLQKTSNLLHGEGPRRETTYQLSISSWTELPDPWMHDASMSTLICDQISFKPPPTGIICVNYPSIQKKLPWRLNAGALLRGEPAPYEVRYIFNFKGEYFDHALVGANLIIFSTYLPSHLYGLTQPESIGMINYGIKEWCDKGLAHLTVLPSIEGQPIGYIFSFQQPLTATQVEQANRSMPFTKMVKLPGNGSEPLEGIHYSREEAWQLLKAWFDRRTGRGA